MNSLDDLLHRATDELRSELDTAPIPQFSPNRRVPRSAAVVAAVVLFFAGSFAGQRFGWFDGQGDVETVVATQPEGVEPQPAPESEAAPEPESAAMPLPEPQATDQSTTQQSTTEQSNTEQSTAEKTEPPTSSTAGQPSLAPLAHSETARLTNAGPGEFIGPLPGAGAFNADESLVLLYRTGDMPAAHIVVDAATGDVIAELSIDAPDIEHVYWNPTAPDELLWLSRDSTNIMRHDVRTGARSVAIAMEDCDSITTGRLGGGPSQDGIFAIMCDRSDSWSMRVANVATGTVTTVNSADGSRSKVDAVRISPSGRFVAVTLEGGSTSVIDIGNLPSAPFRPLAEPGVPTWVALPKDIEALAFASYGDPSGTIVIARPDEPPIVLVGPDTGYEYPPSGTGITATKSVDGTARIVATVRGPEVSGSALTGKVVIATIDDLDGTQPDVRVETFGHGGAAINDYWSSNFVSISPSGRRLVWASDQGTDHTDTFILDLFD